MMANISESKRMCMGGWILAAFIFLGYNGFSLTSLFSPPLVGRSIETRLASQKWLKLEEKMAIISKEAIGDMDFEPILSRFKPDVEEEKKQPPQLKVEPTQFEEKIEIKLPILTGLMKIFDSNGKERWFALIEGQRLKKKESVRDFTIQKITSKGVVIARKGETWFLPTPEIYFSLDREK
jgi:hypothetical protein